MEVKQKNIVKLSANENFYGCSESVKKVLRENINKVSLYPDYFQNDLKSKIAELCKVNADQVMLGTGVVGIIDAIMRFLVKPGGEMITFERSFVAYGQLANLYRKKMHFAKLTDFYCYTGTLLPLINEKTNVIFIANPNNPTGTIINDAHLELFLGKVPKSVFVVIDEAYFEYVDDKYFPDTISLLRKFPNLIVLRGFSKIYGIAGLRIGYGIAEKGTAQLIESHRLPFSINSLVSSATIAAIEDQEYLKVCFEKNKVNREFLYSELLKLKFNVIRSQANFLFMLFKSDQQKEVIFKKLMDDNLHVCNLTVFGQDKSLRIGIGDEETNKRIIDCLSL